MPKPPLIENAMMRNAVVAGVMLVLLVGSLGAAYALVHKRQMRWQDVPTRTVDLGMGLHGEVPETWVEDQSAKSPVRLDYEIVLRDVERPHREFRVMAVRLNGMAPLQWLEQVRRTFAQSAEVTQLDPAQGLPAGFEGRSIQTLYGLNQNTVMDVHAVLIRARDPRLVWVLWLEEAVSADNYTLRSEENKMVLYHVMGSLYLDRDS